MVGDKLGEGQHAAVYKCFKRTQPRSVDECTPLLARQLDAADYDANQIFAVKIVRDDD